MTSGRPLVVHTKGMAAGKTTKRVQTKRTVQKTSNHSAAAQKKPRIFTISFASVYALYVQKAERKGRSQAEVDEVVSWLTGYDGEQLRGILDRKADLETFFAEARLNPNAELIKGVVCGVRVEEVADPLMRKIRYLDKLIDELAKGKKMASILRSPIGA